MLGANLEHFGELVRVALHQNETKPEPWVHRVMPCFQLGKIVNVVEDGINAVAPRQKQSDILVKLLPFDDTGEITILYQEALARGN